MRNFKKFKINFDILSKYLFVFSLSMIIFCYGYFVHSEKIFPFWYLQKAKDVIKSILFDKNANTWDGNDNIFYFYKPTNFTKIIPMYDKNAANNGLSLVTSIIENNSLSMKIIDMEGIVVHKWNVDWFDIWPDVEHLPKESIPKDKPGTHIHGAVLLDNGNLVFNYEHLGMVMLDVCGNIVWRLPYRTHHSIYLDEYNNLWVSGQKNHEIPDPAFPNYEPPFIEPFVLKVSLKGEILNEISIMDLLKDNDLQSLLYMSSRNNYSPKITGDALHLNDVETFPSYMEEGVFKAGDIMVSLRNINAIIVFNEKTRKIKYVSIGGFIRQHDPDFIDGNTISIFDNNNIAPYKSGQQSRILIKSYLNNQSIVYYSGSKQKSFYSLIMGKHQWLQNGNLLITEGSEGRAFEIDKNGNIVWEYINIIDDGYVGIVEEVQRLPTNFTKEFFKQETQKCNNFFRNK